MRLTVAFRKRRIKFQFHIQPEPIRVDASNQRQQPSRLFCVSLPDVRSKISASLHRIISAPVERLAAQYPPCAEGAAPDHALLLHGLDGVAGAGWVEAATRPQPRRQCKLVDSDEADDDSPNRAHGVPRAVRAAKAARQSLAGSPPVRAGQGRSSRGREAGSRRARAESRACEA